MRKLLAGIENFRKRIFPKHAVRFRQLAHAQTPDTFFISCSDSRVIPDLIASADPGDLFTVRNVGNLVPCATADGRSTGDVSEASAIEYALLVLNVKNIVVCGHSECGAMKAVIAGKSQPGAPNLDQWLCHAHGAAAQLAREILPPLNSSHMTDFRNSMCWHKSNISRPTRSSATGSQAGPSV